VLYAAGIYLVIDVNSPEPSRYLNRDEPWTTYTPSYLENVFKVMTVFSGYPNVMAMFAGNEIINDDTSAQNSPRYIKALVRDMKNYMKSNLKRYIPVGYSAADDLKYRLELPKYLSCNDNGLEDGIDFYGLNSYQWCGNNTFQSSGYDTLVENFQNYSEPLFFSEFGCNEVKPRIFQEIGALYSSEMTGVFDGGLIYEYSQEANDYGLVQISSDNSVKILGDYETLKNEYSSVPMPKSTPSTSSGINHPSCLPASSYKNINATSSIPATQAGNLIKNGVQATVGKLVKITNWTTNYTIYDINNKPITDKSVKVVSDPGNSISSSNSEADDDNDDGDKKSFGTRSTSISTLGSILFVFIGIFCASTVF